MLVTRTDEAKDDIREIYKYTFLKFGEAQADIYYDGLEVKINTIIEGVAHYTDCSDIIKGMKRTQYKKHFIYYQQVSKNELLIVRILWQGRDEKRHF